MDCHVEDRGLILGGWVTSLFQMCLPFMLHVGKMPVTCSKWINSWIGQLAILVLLKLHCKHNKNINYTVYFAMVRQSSELCKLCFIYGTLPDKQATCS